MSMTKQDRRRFWLDVAGDAPREWYENSHQASMNSFLSDITMAISATYSKLWVDQKYLARACYTRYKHNVDEPYPWETFYHRVKIETDYALEYFDERGLEQFTLKLFDMQKTVVGAALYVDKWCKTSNYDRFLYFAKFVGFVYAATFKLV